MTPTREVVYAGSQCHCVRVPPTPGHAAARLLLVSHVGEQVVGELRWHAKWQRYVLLPAPNTAWSSIALGEIGLWLRKLSRGRSESG